MIIFAKRIVMTLLVLILSLSLFGCPPQSATTITDSLGYIYQEYGAGYTIYLDNLIQNEEIIVPLEFNGLPIVGIGRYGTAPTANNVVSITLPESLIYIMDHAFDNFINLESITIPSSVESIGEFAFSNCDKLVTIDIPGKVTRLMDYTFYQCSSLTTVIFQGKITEIGRNVFDGAWQLSNIEFHSGSNFSFQPNMILNLNQTSLIYYLRNGDDTTFTVPSGITSIGDYAFYGDSLLEEVFLPEGLKSIGTSSFGLMKQLVSVSMPSTLETIDNYAFYEDENLRYVTLNEGLISIGEKAFGGSHVLSSVYIPSSVQTIYSTSFQYNRALTEIVVDEESDYFISIDGVLFTKDMINLVTYPSGKMDQIYTVPMGVENILTSAFEANYHLRTLYVTEGVKRIENKAFAYCSLSIIYLPSSLEYVGYEAIYGDSNTLIHVALASQPEGWAASWHMKDQLVYWDN